MQRIIVTADDYGMCNEVDRAIDAGIENRFINTTNVILNMKTLSDAADLRTRYPSLSVGIHWNVTTGKPISDPKTIPSLVDENGAFWSIGIFKRKYHNAEITPADLEKELEAQYSLFEKTCGKPDYWNTHENSSLETKAYKVFEKVAVRHGIPATRTFQRVYYDKYGLGIKCAIREFAVKNFFELWFGKIRRTFKMPTARVVSFDKISNQEIFNLPFSNLERNIQDLGEQAARLLVRRFNDPDGPQQRVVVMSKVALLGSEKKIE